MRGVTGKLDTSLFAPGDKVLVACSGGADSLAMLVMLREAAPSLGIRLRAVYVNHGLRPEAGKEGELVVGQAARLGLQGEVVSIAKGQGHSQEDLRRARYEALDAVRLRTGASKLAVAHTANDQAETVLMRLIRGAGTKGLAGIPPVRGYIVRPLLGMLRGDIESFLAERKIRFVSDPSNDKATYLRNRIRRELVPWLLAENPRIIESLCDLAVRMRAADDAVEARAQSVDPTRVTALRELPALVRSRALTHAHLAALERLVVGASGSGEVSLPGGIVARRCYDDLSFGHEQFVIDRVPAEIASGGARFSVVAAEAPNCVQGFSFDADVVPLPWTVRTPRKGDRISVRGLGGRKKLQDLFVDAKVPAEQRSTIAVVIAGSGEILCIPGLRASEHGRPSERTKRLYVVSAISPTSTKA